MLRVNRSGAPSRRSADFAIDDLEPTMIALTKKSILDSIFAAGIGAVCASTASGAHAATYQISVYEDTFGPAAGVPYQNGIIQKYTTDPDGPVNIPQSAGFQYSPAKNEINGIAGDYKVTAVAGNAHGGTAHAYAFGDGGFSGYSTSVNGDGVSYPQQGYTYTSAEVGYGFQLVGPASATPISVTFDAKAYVNTVGTGFGFAYLQVYDDPNNQLVNWALEGGESSQTYPGETIDLLPNTIYAVHEDAVAYGHSTQTDGPYDPTQDSGSADAYVDPTFALTGQYASLYHFEGLPDGALASGVPEPSTWALALMGFAALGMRGISMRRGELSASEGL
jgi:PEP-CTERM motif